MLSDEEKKAIESLNKRYDFLKENPLATNVWLTLDIHNLGIVLNLIEKQSKEIEESKQKEKQAYIDGTNVADELCNKKWKDKIKAKIEEIKNECKYCDFTDEFCQELLQNNNCTQGNTLKVLQSLLEEE